MGSAEGAAAGEAVDLPGRVDDVWSLGAAAVDAFFAVAEEAGGGLAHRLVPFSLFPFRSFRSSRPDAAAAGAAPAATAPTAGFFGAPRCCSPRTCWSLRRLLLREQGQALGFRLLPERRELGRPVLGRGRLELDRQLQGLALAGIDELQKLVLLLFGEAQLVGHLPLDRHGEHADELPLSSGRPRTRRADQHQRADAK